MPNDKGVDMTKAAVSRNEVIRKYGTISKVKSGTGARTDDVLMNTSPDFAVLGNTYDPEWGVQYKKLGEELAKRYQKSYIEGDAISEKTEEINTANSNEAFDELMGRQEQANKMQGNEQKYQDTNNTTFREADGGVVPRYGGGGTLVPAHANVDATATDNATQTGDPNLAYLQAMNYNDMDPELKKQLIESTQGMLRGNAIEGVGQMAGLYDLDTNPEVGGGHFVGGATNPYTQVITEAMMGNMPSMAPYQAEANIDTDQMMHQAALTGNAGARNMAIANSMMAHNAMMNNAQHQVDQMRMQQASSYAGMMEGIGAGDQAAINHASEYNAGEASRVDDINAHNRAQASKNEYFNRINRMAGLKKGIPEADKILDKLKDSGITEKAKELASSAGPKLKNIVENVLKKEMKSADAPETYQAPGEGPDGIGTQEHTDTTDNLTNKTEETEKEKQDLLDELLSLFGGETTQIKPPTKATLAKHKSAR